MTRGKPISIRTAVRRSPLGWLLALAVSLVPSDLGGADSMALPAADQIPILLRILIYDRNLEAKAGKELSIGIIFSPADPVAAKATDEMNDALFKTTREKKTVKKLPIQYYLVEYTNPAELESFVKAKGINVFYISPGNAKNLEVLTRISQARHISTITAVPEYVRKGVAVGIGMVQDSKRIYINLPASRAEGSEFDASLLGLPMVTVIK